MTAFSVPSLQEKIELSCLLVNFSVCFEHNKLKLDSILPSVVHWLSILKQICWPV